MEEVVKHLFCYQIHRYMYHIKFLWCPVLQLLTQISVISCGQQFHSLSTLRKLSVPVCFATSELSPKLWQTVQPFQPGHTGSQNHGKNPPSLALDFNRLAFSLPSLWKNNFVVFHMIPQGVSTWIYLQLPTMIAYSSMHPFILLTSSLLLSLTISQTTYTQGLPLGSTFRKTQRYILGILCLFYCFTVIICKQTQNYMEV